MSARLCVWVLALTLATAARAAGMPAYGTKNFTPGPATPTYFTGERYIPYDGWQGFPAARAFQYRSSSAAAPQPASGDLYARPPEPAQRDIAPQRRSRLAYAHGRYHQTRAEAARGLRLRRVRAWRRGRPLRLRAVRLARARARYKRAWRR